MKTLKVTVRKKLEAVQPDWFPNELEIEKWIFEGTDEDPLVLPEDVFGERFLKIARQVRTREKKRADTSNRRLTSFRWSSGSGGANPACIGTTLATQISSGGIISEKKESFPRALKTNPVMKVNAFSKDTLRVIA